MQGINSLLNSSQVSLQDRHNNNSNQIQNSHMNINNNQHNTDFDLTSHDDFLQQILSNLHSSTWPDVYPDDDNNNNNKTDETVPSYTENNVSPFPCDGQTSLASKFRSHQINATSPTNKAAATALLLHHQLLMSRGVAGDCDLLQMPLSFGGNDVADGSSFKSSNPSADEVSVQALYNGFAESLHGTGQGSNHTQHFRSLQVQNFGASGGGTNDQAAPASGAAGGTAVTEGENRREDEGPTRTRSQCQQGKDSLQLQSRAPTISPATGIRTKAPSHRQHLTGIGTGIRTKPPSESESFRSNHSASCGYHPIHLLRLTDKASMLDEIIDYVKFLQLQVKVLSMSRLGGAAAVAPLVADISSEGGSGCVQANGNGALQRNQTVPSTSNDNSLTMTEHQVAKLMEEDMGSAMQYLQGKGLCLMPISLATAISTSTCHTRRNNNNNNPLTNGNDKQIPNHNGENLNPTVGSNGEGPLSPTGNNDSAVKDAASVSKP
ncbi:hypothetical protein RIF29_09558 [Crotalaria pallida]|uniref:Uncharacterized protein n=1 Tax=Crotalaria pallida TaxID=3830 RepID=A0AAN9FY96_CROPI